MDARRKFTLAAVVIVTLALGTVAFAAEVPAESRIVSAGLFKNGLAVVTRAVSVEGPGTYVVADVPNPVHGTFWIESDAVVETRVTQRTVREPVRPNARENIQEDIAGRSFLVLDTDKGRIYVDSSMIAQMSAEGRDVLTTRRRLPVLVLTVKEVPSGSGMILISYLEKGMAWAPSYQVDISGEKELTIRQKAVIKNELADLQEAEVQLISGFPSVQFGHVTSLLSASTTLNTFFQQLAQDPRRATGMGQVVTQQAVMFNAAIAEPGLDLSATPLGEGPDVHYQPIGKLSLAEGESISLQVAVGKAAYERIVEWIVPDTRRADGRYIQDHERRQNPDLYQDAAWDAVRFRNPLELPMTTAPAMIVADGRFLGQQVSYWTNKGEQATLHITKALSVRTRAVEHELPGERQQVIWIAGDDFQKCTVKGQLMLNNHRNEDIKLVIRRRFSGELLSADGDPSSVLLEEGAYSVNERNELLWTLTLEAGEEKTLSYTYSVLVNI